MYQWGRKDPFTPSVKPTYNTEPGEEIQLYKGDGTKINKGTAGLGGEFTATNLTPPDISAAIPLPSLLYNILNRNWWTEKIKTMYDPCPYGYRVPTRYAYPNFKQGTYDDTKDMYAAGVIWNNSWFPAGGERHFIFKNTGIQANYWTSDITTDYSDTAYLLNINTNRNPNNINYNPMQTRTINSCSPLRCQKE